MIESRGILTGPRDILVPTVAGSRTMWRRRACREALVVIASVAILEIGGPTGSGGPYLGTDEALSKSKQILDELFCELF